MQTTRPRITWKVLPMAQVAIFKEIFDQVRKDLNCELFYSELKRHNVSHYIYYLATDNIHIVLEKSTNIKDITIPLIIHYYLLRAFRTLHKSFHAKS